MSTRLLCPGSLRITLMNRPTQWRAVIYAVLAPALALLIAGCASGHLSPPSGKAVYETHCASCHGIDGRGGGPVAETIAMPVPDLTRLSARSGGAMPRDTISAYIDGRNMPDAHGARLMPVWGLVFATTESIVPGADPPDARIATLLDYLETIQRP